MYTTRNYCVWIIQLRFLSLLFDGVFPQGELVVSVHWAKLLDFVDSETLHW